MTFDVAVSRANERYARVSETFHAPFSAGCSASEGWRRLGDASDPFPCGFRGVPAKVLRTLFGSCS